MDRLTKEQIEGMRTTLVRLWREAGILHDPMPNVLCDMALQSLSLESVRSEALEELESLIDFNWPQAFNMQQKVKALSLIRVLQSPARVAERPEWDGYIRFDSDCVVNGTAVKAGTSWGPFEKSKNTAAREDVHSTELRK